MSDGRAGTVFDIGYQRYTGAREGRWRAWRAVFKDGVRRALGLGRDMQAKRLPWLFIGVLAFIALVMALVAGGAQRFIGAEAAAQLDLPTHSDYYGIASFIILLFAAVSAPEQLCPDRREGVISLYLVRPLSGPDYVMARWTAFFTVMLRAVWIPQLILLIGLMMGNPDPLEYLLDNWLDIPKIIASGAALAAYTTTIAMFVASFTTRRTYASVFLIGLFAITTPFTTGVAMEVGGTLGQWISMFNLSNIPVHVNDIIFGEVSEITAEAPAGELPDWLLIGWFFLWTLVPAGVLWMRYRRLTP